MNKTKQKILAASLRLFNENGMVNVSLRQIAKSINISQGNLNYHFKLKEDIVEALYFQLVEEMDNQMKEMMDMNISLTNLYSISFKTMQKMFEYKFIMIDFIHIMKSVNTIKTHYQQLMTIRKNQYQSLFNILIESGILRTEAFSDEYKRLYERMNIVGDNWINTYITFNQDKSIDYYCELLFEMIYPYLTSTGKKEYGLIERT